ncbi:Bacteriophage CII protein [[Pasteurella] mairii]|uniref:Bacteriophage CII protein n=1 Tax=[Pasteurella] mairii TaxID=757 RepID=A0A379B4X0_9PAST|nr:Bacteriophage CII protein [[Pasteurella] mairii]
MARNKKAKEMTALEIESEILKQIDLNDLDDIGEIVGVCGSAISKWKGDQKITKFSRLLFAIGLKVVPQDQVFVDKGLYWRNTTNGTWD